MRLWVQSLVLRRENPTKNRTACDSCPIAGCVSMKLVYQIDTAPWRILLSPKK
jgi:hypothetical protein